MSAEHPSLLQHEICITIYVLFGRSGSKKDVPDLDPVFFLNSAWSEASCSSLDRKDSITLMLDVGLKR